MKQYIKNNLVSFANQIIVKKNGMQIINPDEETILSDGWIEYVPLAVKLSKQNEEYVYKNEVIKRIRLKYSIDDEIAILRQRDTKTEEFEEYNKYVEECKSKVKIKSIMKTITPDE